MVDGTDGALGGRYSGAEVVGFNSDGLGSLPCASSGPICLPKMKVFAGKFGRIFSPGKLYRYR